MPVCFQLIDKTTMKPEKLAVVDNKLCAFLGVVPDPVNYYKGWYDGIGFGLALGKSWDELRQTFPSALGVKIINWLEENYDVNAFRE